MAEKGYFKVPEITNKSPILPCSLAKLSTAVCLCSGLVYKP